MSISRAKWLNNRLVRERAVQKWEGYTEMDLYNDWLTEWLTDWLTSIYLWFVPSSKLCQRLMRLLGGRPNSYHVQTRATLLHCHLNTHATAVTWTPTLLHCYYSTNTAISSPKFLPNSHSVLRHPPIKVAFNWLHFPISIRFTINISQHSLCPQYLTL